MDLKPEFLERGLEEMSLWVAAEVPSPQSSSHFVWFRVHNPELPAAESSSFLGPDQRCPGPLPDPPGMAPLLAIPEPPLRLPFCLDGPNCVFRSPNRDSPSSLLEEVTHDEFSVVHGEVSDPNEFDSELEFHTCFCSRATLWDVCGRGDELEDVDRRQSMYLVRGCVVCWLAIGLWRQ